MNCLNQLFTLNERFHQGSDPCRIESKRLKQFKIPTAFLSNYQQQKQNCDTTKDKKLQFSEPADSNKRFWKEHEEIIKKYSRKDRAYGGLKNKGRFNYSEEDQRRILSADPKNVFLRKLIKSGKIPNYNKEEL
jgi:hypothetical protein